MSDRPSIVILTASAGAGHNIAALAVEEAVREQAPRARVEVLDVLEFSNRFFRRLYAQGYLSLIRRAPTAMGILYDIMDRPDQGVRDALRRSFQSINLGKAQSYLSKLAPDLVINTHFLPAEMVAHLRRSGRLDCRQATVTTDFETHRMWVHRPTERYYTATEEGKEYLCSWGVDRAAVRVTGIPVRNSFVSPLSRDVARRSEGLSLDVPVLLLLCGGFGVGPTEALLEGLLSIDRKVQIVVNSGNNDELRVRLEAATRRSAKAVRVIGYTDHVASWMAAADLIISKPGGLTASEALAVGVPIVIVSPIPGQEGRNSDYLLEHGAAIKVNHPRLLGYRVSRLIDDGARIESLRAAVRRLARPSAARDIAADALSLISNGSGSTPRFGSLPPTDSEIRMERS